MWRYSMALRSIHLAIRLHQLERVQALVEVMSSLTPFESKAWVMLVSLGLRIYVCLDPRPLGWAMLCLSDIRYFKTGL